jgi:hypothetical protein
LDLLVDQNQNQSKHTNKGEHGEEDDVGEHEDHLLSREWRWHWTWSFCYGEWKSIGLGPLVEENAKTTQLAKRYGYLSRRFFYFFFQLRCIHGRPHWCPRQFHRARAAPGPVG